MNGKIVLGFLELLIKNNNRDWFKANRVLYEDALSEINKLIIFLIPKLQELDSQIGVLSEKQVLFRIYRDVRFSKNKEPYKTHFGLFFANGGRKSKLPGYYLHIEPNGKSFVGGGIYMPEKDVLNSIREEMLINAPAFLDIFSNSNFEKYYSNLSDYGMLKRIPRGFPKDFEYPELLKHKHFVVDHNLKDSEVLNENFEEKVVDAFETLSVFNRFLYNCCIFFYAVNAFVLDK